MPADFRGILFAEEVPLPEDEFRIFKELLFGCAGIHLNDSKKSLVQARLGPHLRAMGMKDFSEYRRYLQNAAPQDQEWQAFINLLTTNKTDFFREPAHFEYLLKTFLPAWLKNGGRHLKVWSAACSTGQEPYTLAMCLKAHLPENCQVSILATDIDTSVLRDAENAVYPRLLSSQIPEAYRDAISYGTDEIRDWMRIRLEWKDMVTFRPYNLVTDSPPPEAPFDVIFCRNVLIYFSKETIIRVVENLADSIQPEGVLMISHSESLHGLPTSWRNLRPSIMKKKNSRS